MQNILIDVAALLISVSAVIGIEHMIDRLSNQKARKRAYIIWFVCALVFWLVIRLLLG